MGMAAGLAFRLMASLEPFFFPAPWPKLSPSCVSQQTGDSQLDKGTDTGLTQTPPCAFKIMCYSHRGGAQDPGVWQENTMGAFRHSQRIGIDLLEMDVQLTKDSQVVVFHDSQGLGRMCGPSWNGRRVADLDYRDLPPLLARKAAFPPSISMASTSPPKHQLPEKRQPWEEVAADDTRIPLLAEVLREFPDIPIQVDLKVDTPGLVQAVHSLLTQHPARTGLTIWGSFHHKVQVELYHTDNTIPLFMSAWRSLYLRLAHATGQLSEVDVYESVVIQPWRVRRPGWGYWYPFLDRGWSEALAARGVALVLYSDVNDVQAYAACLQAGASAVCTDRPAHFISYLKATRSATASSDSLGTAGGPSAVQCTKGSD